MKLLLISNSTMAGEAYLGWPRIHIEKFLNQNKSKKVCFVPYAGVSLSKKSLHDSFDQYAQKVAEVFREMGIALQSVHHANDPVEMIRQAEAIVVGGGNTFHLVASLYEKGLMEAIREQVVAGTPYIGWSAGSNVACPTLMTTNDMPIVEPASFKTLNLIPFQINPHYLDANPEGHGGETRQQRIEEYLIMNPKMKVVGLREGCLLLVENDDLQLMGSHSMRYFEHNHQPLEFEPGSDIRFLLKAD